jgi:hypothetical protein
MNLNTVPNRTEQGADRYNVRSAPVAQLDRAAGFEPVGREFESLRARQKTQIIQMFGVNTGVFSKAA